MWEILQYPFFQNALLGSLLASILCAIVGTYIVSRRLVFISGGITHASFGGIGLGVYFGLNPILSAMAFAVASALGVEWMSRKGDVREDSAIAMQKAVACEAAHKEMPHQYPRHVYRSICHHHSSDAELPNGYHYQHFHESKTYCAPEVDI
jgi:hypothetical protein